MANTFHSKSSETTNQNASEERAAQVALLFKGHFSLFGVIDYWLWIRSDELLGRLYFENGLRVGH